MVVVSNNNDAKSITVFGATGSQGGSVIRHLLTSDKPYRIRAVTRDTTKPASQKLTEQGIEVTQAELGNREQIEKAIQGQEIVFLVTNFWEHGRDGEIAHGRLVMDISKSAGVKKVIWSGLESVNKVSNGKYTKCEHWDSKAEIFDYGRSIGAPVIDVQVGFYMENFAHPMLAARKGEDGSFVFAFPVSPSTKFSMINCSTDYGAFVRGAIESDVPVGEQIFACAEQIEIQAVAETWAQGTGQKAHFHSVDADYYRSLAGDELSQQMGYFRDYGYYGGKDIAPSKKILPEGYHVRSWKEFVETQDWSAIIA